MIVRRRMVSALALFAVGAVVLADASAQAAPAQQPSLHGVEARQATMRLASFPNQVVDIANASVDTGAQAIQWNLSGALNQMWETEASLDGYYRFKSANSGKCLNVTAASGADGAPIVQLPCGGTPSELWKPVRRVIGYQLVNKSAGKCLTVGGGAGTGHSLVQTTCSPGANNDVWLVVWEPPV